MELQYYHVHVWLDDKNMRLRKSLSNIELVGKHLFELK